MAVVQPLIPRQTRMAAKLETTTGTAISLAASDGTFISYNGRIDPRLPTTRRQKPGSSSNMKAKVQSEAADISLTLEMMGAGSAALPAWAVFLKAAGWAASGLVMSLVTGSASADTLTVGHYVDGRLRQAAGCAFDWTMRLESGMPGYIDLRGQGAHVAPTATALISPTYTTVNPPVVRGITFTIASTNYTTNLITISGGNTLYLRPDVSSPTGYKACCIPDRDPTVNVSVEALPIGTKDWMSDHVSEVEAALSIVIGSTSNNTMTIAAPKIQLREAPKDGDRNGVLTDELLFQLNLDSAEDDELTLTFS